MVETRSLVSWAAIGAVFGLGFSVGVQVLLVVSFAAAALDGMCARPSA
jgi:hypothetical protein